MVLDHGMRNSCLLLAAALLTMSLSGCGGSSTQRTSTSYVSPEVLESYRTYAWSSKRSLLLRDPSRNTASTQAMLESSIEAELAAKGFVKSSSGAADLMVTYIVVSRSMETSQEFTTLGELSQSQIDEEGGLGGMLAARGTLVTDYEQARVNLDLVERKSGKLIYRGIALADMLKNPSASRSSSRINSAVKAMLKDLPAR